MQCIRISSVFFHLIHLHNVYAVIHIICFEVIYKQLPDCFPSLTPPLQTSWSLVFLLCPRQSSYIHCHWWHKSNVGIFIHLHVLHLTTSCSLSFDLSHPHKKWRNPTLQRILDRYERERGWREERGEVWQNKNIPGEHNWVCSLR